MSNIDLNELVSFIAVVQAGSFSAAARRAGVPANTLSRRVQHLESCLGVKLMQRSTRQLVVTRAGRLLFERCEQATSVIDLASQEIADLTDAVAGAIRIAAPVDFFDIFKPAWVAQFLATHKEVRLEFAFDDTIVNMIAERIDMALRFGQLASSGLVARRLGPTHHLLVAAPSYLREQGTPEKVADLATHDCITLLHPEGRNRWLLHGPRGIEEVNVRGRVSFNNSQSLHRAALAGMGIALVPALLATQDLTSGRLVRVLARHVRDGGAVYAVFPGRGHVPAAASLFASFVAEKLSPLWPQDFGRSHPPTAESEHSHMPNLADLADLGGALCEEQLT